MANRHEMWELRQLQALPLDAKIRKTQLRIREWIDTFGENGVYVSFSGGKDSTVLLDIVRKMYPNIEAVFVNTGLEYPSVRQFALSHENVTEIQPKMNFYDVVVKYGYPVLSKKISHSVSVARRNPNGNVMKNIFNPSKKGMYALYRYAYLIAAPFLLSEKCCDEMKKKPLKDIGKKKKPMIATMAEESTLRRDSWLHNGCNAFNMQKPQSRPMSFWMENDVLTYLYKNKLKIAKDYGDIEIIRENGQVSVAEILGDYSECLFYTKGCHRTGCVFCGFGITHDLDRFTRLAKEEPKLCDYVMRGGGFDETDGLWKPTKDGMGYWFVLEWLNIHGNFKIGIPNREKYLSEYQTEETRKWLESEEK